jgi:hypothetical protein
MELTSGWTARAACALQAALRLSNESFAAQLGIGVRTVASWHQKPTLRPQSEMQQILDTKLEQAAAAHEQGALVPRTPKHHRGPTSRPRASGAPTHTGSRP